MDLILTNQEYDADGIFGTLTFNSGDKDVMVCWTLQHAYDSGNGNGSFIPKVPAGEYTCVRGWHRLASMTSSFQTFEITNVPGHTNILFHSGNTEKDSEGCVLLGLSRGQLNGVRAVLESRDAFLKFMNLQENVQTFKLTVKETK